jgi:galactokinase
MDVAARTDRLVGEFGNRAGRAPEGVWGAPGRVNLIGEHTDYNDGFVLPFAIGRCAFAALAPRSDAAVRCWTMQPDAAGDQPEAPPGGADAVPLDSIGPANAPAGWTAYPLGVAWALRQAGVDVPGFDLVVDSDVPTGAGVSSSAALMGSVALALAELTGAELSRTDLALAGRRAENEIVGAPTGVMDEMAALCASAGHALFLDCRSLQTRQVPLDLAAAELRLLVLNTRTVHQHSASEYGQRRDACERAAKALGVAALRDVSVENLPEVEQRLDELTFRRARHVLTENARVHRAADLLERSDLRAVGRLLIESHLSMRDDFEISTAELDTAVDSALHAGAWGARMTGGGFGGSAIALTPVDRIEAVSEFVTSEFARRGYRTPEIFAVEPADGAHRVRG